MSPRYRSRTVGSSGREEGGIGQHEIAHEARLDSCSSRRSRRTASSSSRTSAVLDGSRVAYSDSAPAGETMQTRSSQAVLPDWK